MKPKKKLTHVDHIRISSAYPPRFKCIQSICMSREFREPFWIYEWHWRLHMNIKTNRTNKDIFISNFKLVAFWEKYGIFSEWFKFIVEICIVHMLLICLAWESVITIIKKTFKSTQCESCLHHQQRFSSFLGHFKNGIAHVNWGKIIAIQFSFRLLFLKCNLNAIE